MNTLKVPDIIVSRLPVYLRALQRLSEAGTVTTSSQELGEKLGISAAQIRKDLSQFGEFGKQGTGYQIEYLSVQLRDILHVNREWEVAVVGAGRGPRPPRHVHRDGLVYLEGEAGRWIRRNVKRSPSHPIASRRSSEATGLPVAALSRYQTIQVPPSIRTGAGTPPRPPAS